MEFVAALVGSLAWPFVVGVLALVVWLSAPPTTRAGLLGRIRKAGPVELSEAAADVTAATNPQVGRAPSHAPEEESPTHDGLPFDPNIRRHMDSLIEAAARWGWVRAGRAVDDFPRPLIAWTPHGATIVRTSGHRAVSEADTVTFAAGSFIDAHTGRPNTAAYTRTNYPPSAPSIEEPED